MTVALVIIAATVVTVGTVATIRHRGTFRRAIRIARAFATDQRIPKHLRYMVAFGLLPIPGPFDDVVLVIAGIIIVTRHRSTVREILKEAQVA